MNNIDIAKEVAREAAKDIAAAMNEIRESDKSRAAFAEEGWRITVENSEKTIVRLWKVIIGLVIVVAVQFLVMVGAVMWFWANVEITDYVSQQWYWEGDEGHFDGDLEMHIFPPVIE